MVLGVNLLKNHSFSVNHNPNNFKSDFLKDFYNRGFFLQSTNPEALDDLLSKERVNAYIGFDLTAKSLHAGSLVQIMIARLLQKHGHRPIILMGGATTKIGDPSGKDKSRKMLNNDEIKENLSGIKATLEKFIDFNGQDGAIMVNNQEWLDDLNYLNFLREVGYHFSINKMLTFDSVRLRLDREQNLSFLEFNYMILQAYDFYILNQKYNCRLQIGGSDQWGNIVNGVELTRRIKFDKSNSNKDEVFGLTSELLTLSDGSKMGKTADGAIWLDNSMLDSFDYFQYFRNVNDPDVGKFLRLFTDLEIKEIKKLESLQDQEINKAKDILAYEATKICHGQRIADENLKRAREIFINKSSAGFEERVVRVSNSEIKLTEIIKEIGATESLSQAKKLIQGGGIKVDDSKISDINFQVTGLDNFNLAVGKKKFFKIKLEVS